MCVFSRDLIQETPFPLYPDSSAGIWDAGPSTCFAWLKQKPNKHKTLNKQQQQQKTSNKKLTTNQNPQPTQPNHQP